MKITNTNFDGPVKNLPMMFIAYHVGSKFTLGTT